MSREYQVTLDEKPYDVEVKMLDEGGVLVVKVGDESYTIKARKTDEASWTVNDTSTDYAVKVLRRSGRSLLVEINGQEREVEWERVRRQEVSASTSTAASGGAKVVGGVYAPMPGKITEVRVAVGDSVKSGDTVAILEAMKMFNELKVGKGGKVKEVNVAPGSAVTPTDLLVLVE
jgi:biotin carboxyl carrier protein